jgi:leucyl aminopeptidase
MRTKTTLATAALLLAFTLQAQAGPKVWISLGDAAYAQLQKLSATPLKPLSSVQAAPLALAGTERVHLVEVDEDMLAGLSEAVHHELRRCGGYVFHSSQAEGLAALQRLAGAARVPPQTTRPSYVIDQQAVVPPLLAQMQSSLIGQTIVDLSSFVNRYYQSQAGVAASDWLKNRWTQLASGRSDITVTQFNHPNWKQKSVIATIAGTDNGSEIVVLGGHLDSIRSGGMGENTVAPGADDDASGIASLTEALRVIVVSGYKPRRTIKFMAYAAEEVGLRGSAEIAKAHKVAGANVVGVLQLDMTNFKGSASDIYIYTDYTDATQNGFVGNLVGAYLPTLGVGSDRCGYGCSDHASWSAQGYAASFPFEASFAGSNPHIHTANDTFANMGSQAEHALKFARLALAYAVELGSDGPGVAQPPDKTETFSGSLLLNQTRSFGPFKVAAGGRISASTAGTGDIDLYVKLGSVPTTSNYGCKSDGNTATESCSISVSSNSDGYVMVRGYTAGSYKLKVSYRPQ